jgi:hypothetical protein
MNILSIGVIVIVLASAPAVAQESAPVRGAATHTVTDVSDILSSHDKFDLVGVPAAFAHARVQHIAGARSFWIGDTRSHRVFVVVDALSLKGATGSDRDMADGDTVAVDGTIERVPGTLGEVRVTNWGRLDDADAWALSERDVYVYAKRVRLLEAAGKTPAAR